MSLIEGKIYGYTYFSKTNPNMVMIMEIKEQSKYGKCLVKTIDCETLEIRELHPSWLKELNDTNYKKIYYSDIKQQIEILKNFIIKMKSTLNVIDNVINKTKQITLSGGGETNIQQEKINEFQWVDEIIKLNKDKTPEEQVDSLMECSEALVLILKNIKLIIEAKYI